MVIIPTTDGPVLVQRLAEEDPELRSVICLDRTSDELPISGAYDKFVREPSGVIEREFGHKVYRMDFSDWISNGDSWKLGVFAAHLLHNQGKLAERSEDATHALWLTGKVNVDLDVGTVEDITKKLERSEKMLLEHVARGQKVVIAFPKENEKEVNRALKKSGLDKANIKLRPVAKTDDLKGVLDLDPVNTMSGIPRQETPVSVNKQMRSRPLMAWLACALMLIVMVFLGWDVFGDISRWRSMAAKGAYEKLLQDMKITKTSACMTCRASAAIYPLLARLGQTGRRDELTAKEVRAPKGRTCASVRFSSDTPVERPVQEEADERFASSTADGLCGLVYKLKNAGSQTFHGWLSIRIRSGKLARISTRGGTDQARLAPGEDISISVNIPEWLGSDVTYSVHAIVDGKASDDVTRLMEGGRLDAPGLRERFMTHEVKLTKN